jgi:AAA domain-containing protein
VRSDEDLRAFVDRAEIFSDRFGNGVDGDQSSIGRGPWAHFDFLPIGAASGLEPIDWLIDGYIEAGSLVVLYGPSGSTKTFIALHMGLSIATGRPFFGQAVRQAAVLYIAAEGRRGLGRRHAAWCIANGTPLGERERIPLFRSTAAGRVMDQNFMRRLVALIDAMPEKPVLIVFDTVSKTFGLQKEDNESISAALAILQIDLIDRFGCTVFAIHHTGKDATRGARGGSSLECDADAMYEAAIERPKTDDENAIELGGSRFDFRRDKVRLVCRKMKDAEPPPDMLFGARLVEIGSDPSGHTITSLALVPGLTPEDHKIIDLLLHGVSIREIAARTGISKSAIARRKAIYMAMGALG